MLSLSHLGELISLLKSKFLRLLKHEVENVDIAKVQADTKNTAENELNDIYLFHWTSLKATNVDSVIEEAKTVEIEEERQEMKKSKRNR